MTEKLYWYCTDFCINLANLLAISYEAFNIGLFLILFPATTIILVVRLLFLKLKSCKIQTS